MTKRKHKRNRELKTPLKGHVLKGKTLEPPFALLHKKLTNSSWIDDRLPEMLWAALILAEFGRDDALKIFRRVLKFIGQHSKRDQLFDMTLTGIANLAAELQSDLLMNLCYQESIAYALQPLLLFPSVPARAAWETVLPDGRPDEKLLMKAIGLTLWHQSQEATDCRWVKVMAEVLSGRFQIPPDIAEQWFGYPNVGDQREVRPTIRAAEITPRLNSPDLTWPRDFWRVCWASTPCLELPSKNGIELQTPATSTTSRDAVNNARDSLRQHWQQTHSTTAIDAKHDCIFGTAFYALRILEELLSIGTAQSVLGRLGLRTLLDVRVNLRYLLKADKEVNWEKWRRYGSGQAKLNALKLDGMEQSPSFVDQESLENIANEDIWEEMVSIKLGHWTEKDLRKLSIECGLKDTYDRYYSWSSAFVHGNWGAVRESSYTTCGNPLHRLHRYPKDHQLPDVISDAVCLVDQILAEVGSVYPGFVARTQIEGGS